jgi:hypothetical protein
MRRHVLFLPVAWLLASCAGTDARVAELEGQLRDRDAEIAQLRQRLGSTPGQNTMAQADAPQPPSSAPGASTPKQAATNVPEEETSRALEQALVRQGGSVLPKGSVMVEPEVSYIYSEPDQGRRRDTWVSAATVRVGLPWDIEANVTVPYVLHDRQSGIGRTAGLGDINLGLTKPLVAERDYVPDLLVFGNWKSTTGRSDGALPTGTGANAYQAGLTAVKRQDPLVLFGSLSYTWNGRSGQVDYGNSLGGTLGTILAATPDTSVLVDVNLNSSFASRVGGQRIGTSDRLSGVFEVGTATVLGRDLLLNVTAGVGFTPSAPDFQLTVSVPKGF